MTAPERLQKRQDLLDRIERLTELPLMVLAFAMVPLLVSSLLWDLSPASKVVVFALGAFIWAVFAADLAVKIAVAPHRLNYLKEHWLEVLVVVLPLARPLRILHIVVFGIRAYRDATRLVRFDYLATYAIGLVLVVATAVATVERGHNSEIESFPDALWWAVATVTTVGYGDVVPATVAGRAFGYVLMIGGIGIFGAFTANVATILIRHGEPDGSDTADLAEEIRALRIELTRSADTQIENSK